MADKDSLEYERIEFSEVYHSVTQGPHKPVQAVIRDQQELQKLLPDIAVPLVDFGVKQLIVVALGDKPTSGYDVRITSVMYLTDRLQGRPPLTMVNYSDTEKGGPSDRQSSPIYLVSTRRLEGEGIQSRCREMIDVRTCALNDEAQRVDHIKFKEAFMSEKKSDPGKCSDWKA